MSILDDGFFVAKNFFKNVSMIKLLLIVMTIAMISLNIFSFEGYCDSKGTNTADLAPMATDIDKPISNEERYKDSQGEAPNLKEIKEPVSDDEKNRLNTRENKSTNNDIEYDDIVYFGINNGELNLSSKDFGDEFAVKGSIAKNDAEYVFNDKKRLNVLAYKGIDYTKIDKVIIKDDIHLYPNLPLFSGMESLQEIINIENIKLDNWTSLNSCFYNCRSLKTIDISKLDTKSIKDMSFMFDGCEKIEFVNLTGIDMTSVIDLSYMFNNCKSLKTVAVKNDTLKNVKTMHKMFNSCLGLENIDLSIWYLNSLEDASYLFSDCTNLTYVNLNNITTEKLKDVSYMFNNCENLDGVDMKLLNITNLVDARGMFTNTEFITKVEFNHNGLNFQVNADDMYSGCKKLEKPDVYIVRHNSSISKVFKDCPNIKELDLSMLSYNGALDEMGFGTSKGIQKILLRKGQRVENSELNKVVVYVD